MKTHLPKRILAAAPGFALIVTLSLMILLTVVAVGLLTLSSISLRSTSQGEAMQIAKANARTSLIIAIGELQKHAGDDRRITMAADQIPASNGTSTAATQGRRHWTGVYRSWAPDPSRIVAQWPARPDPEFLSWLVSPPGLTTPEAATAASAAGDRIRLVGPGSAGQTADKWVEVRKMPIRQGTSIRGNMAWWVGDQGLKSNITKEKTAATSLAGDARHTMQSAATADIRTMGSATSKPFADADFFSPMLRSLTSVGQTDHLINASAHEAASELFHDMAVGSSGLLTDVRRGGFRKDLSMQLENNTTPTQRNSLAQNVLYVVPSKNGVSQEPGINMEELAAYYKLHTQLVTGSGRYTTDGAIMNSGPRSALAFQPTPSGCRDDYYHLFKQPVPIAYDTFLSLEAEVASTSSAGVKTYNIRVVVDPVVIMWNPLDVPITIPQGSVPSIKYWFPPFTVKVDTTAANGTITTRRCHLHNSLSDGDHNYMSLDLTVQGTPLVFRPGEVVMISQTSKQRVGTNRHQIPGGPGFAFQNGYSTPLRYGDSKSSRVQLTATDGQTMRVSLEPNAWVNPKSGGPGIFPGLGGHSRWYSLMHNEMYLGRDRNAGTSLPIGGAYLDWDLSTIRQTRNAALRTSSTPGNKRDNQRLYANRLPDLPPFGDPVQVSVSDIAVVKKPFGFLSFRAKTESGINGRTRGTSWLPRFNPKVFLQDFYSFSAEERDISPFEFHVMRLSDLRDYGLLEQNQGRAFFGAAWSLGDGGQTSIITHSVPREPIISLGAFQHSMANGFLFIQPKETPGNGYGTINTRDPLHPQISHPIGNSLAPSIMEPSQTYSIMTDGSGRPFADHSYLANRALWDDYFLSSIATLPAATTALAGKGQKDLADGFFKGSMQLPNRRYVADLGNLTSSEAVNKLFSGTAPRVEAKDIVASLLRVEGLFNVNSTSVEAWKSILSGLRESTIATQGPQGPAGVTPAGTGNTPISGLLTPHDRVVGNSTFQEPAPWIGRRQLSDPQVETLANTIVREIRRSGPFLSLADFVNRRPGSDEKLAVAGVIERALREGGNDNVNEALRSNDSIVASNVAQRFKFPDAEAGLKSHGIPGIIKQADILTPIAPFISVRSDSFVIRAYGESLDSAGKIVASAWCEAVVERNKEFLDPADVPEKPLASLTKSVNRDFGRRYVIQSFRWLQPSEV